MFSDKKKEEGLPDLPPVKSAFGSPVDSDQMGGDDHSLPSFPDSPTHNGFSQAAIKDAVGSGEEIPGSSDDSDVKVVEMEEWSPSIPEAPPISHQQGIGASLGAPPGFEGTRQIAPQVQLPDISQRIMPPPVPVMNAPKGVDVFVKIDKFHSAKKTLTEVKGKLNEIDDLIKKIRETKMREEQEIVSWERDLTFAKTRIQEISDNIFDKVA